jgi:hypothetical protein
MERQLLSSQPVARGWMNTCCPEGMFVEWDIPLLMNSPLRVRYWSPMKLIGRGFPDEEDLRNQTGIKINYNSVINRESEG